MMPMVLEAWKMRENKNLLFLTYEELKEDIDTCINKISDFLGMSRLSKDKLDLLKQHIKFDNLKV